MSPRVKEKFSNMTFEIENEPSQQRTPCQQHQDIIILPLSTTVLFGDIHMEAYSWRTGGN